MNTIFSSASKIVFISIALAIIGLTFIGKLDPKDFMVLASSVFAFYFGKQQPESVDKPIVTSEQLG